MIYASFYPMKMLSHAMSLPITCELSSGYISACTCYACFDWCQIGLLMRSVGSLVPPVPLMKERIRTCNCVHTISKLLLTLQKTALHLWRRSRGLRLPRILGVSLPTFELSLCLTE